MAYDRFIIAPFNIGLETDLRPWLIPDQAFAKLNNAYVWRGRVRKRFGTTFMGNTFGAGFTNSRLRLSVGTITSGALSVTVPGGVGAIGQMFSIGSELFTVYQSSGAMLDTGSTTTKTFNTATGALVISGNPSVDTTPVYWYPSNPVMGFVNYLVGSINNEPLYAFDTQFAYKFSGTAWARSGSVIWHGDNSDFFWSTNWRSNVDSTVALFTSNFQAAVGTGVATDDPIWYTDDGTTWSPLSYSPDSSLNPTNEQPLTVLTTDSGNNQIITSYVQTARIIVVFKNRLLLLNTIENNANGATAFDPMNPTTTGITPTNYLTSTNTAFVNRCRYSQVGDPTAPNAWLEDNLTYDPGGTGVLYSPNTGSFIDAATEEAIVSAEFIKDRLIVYFERSTWEIVFTGNQAAPFLWQKINTELGSEATFSTVPFDRQVLSIGNTGVHACSGSNVERIDNLIPEEIFNIETMSGASQRTYGIRDYFSELVYWSFVSSNATPSQVYPNRILVYNYKNGSWAFNDDTFTAFGYFEQQTDYVWSDCTFTWQSADFDWQSGVVEAQARTVVAGNQQGFTFIVNIDIARNAPSLQITNMAQSGGTVNLTIIGSNLANNDYIYIENVDVLDEGIYQVQSVSSNGNTVTIFGTLSDTYTGGATAARVSVIDIWSKQWNPYVDKSRNVYIQKIDFGVEKTTYGQITVDYFPSTSGVSMLQSGYATNAELGNPFNPNADPSTIVATPQSGTLETSPYALIPLESTQSRLWHPVYFQTDGECVQIRIYLSDLQMRNTDVATSNFVIEGMVLYTMPTTSRLQ